MTRATQAETRAGAQAQTQDKLRDKQNRKHKKKETFSIFLSLRLYLRRYVLRVNQNDAITKKLKVVSVSEGVTSKTIQSRSGLRTGNVSRLLWW